MYPACATMQTSQTAVKFHPAFGSNRIPHPHDYAGMFVGETRAQP